MGDIVPTGSKSRGWLRRLSRKLSRVWSKNARRVAATATGFQRRFWLFAAGGFGAVAIAIASLGIEQVLAEGWAWSSRLCSYTFWLIAFLLAWWGAAEWRLFLSRTTGTLYYIRMMPAAARNWHIEAQLAARDRFLNSVQVIRNIDSALVDGVIDLRDEIAVAEDKLQDLFNADDDKTGYMLAPDLWATAAVALGYRITTPPETLFYDLGDRGNSATVIDGWSLDDGRDRNEPKIEARHHAERGATGLHVHAAFTREPSYAPLSLPVRESHEIGVWKKDDQSELGTDELASVLVGVDKGCVHPATAAYSWVSAIRAALHCANGEPVLLTAKAPKTVTLAAGYLLAPAHTSTTASKSQDPGCGVEGCRRKSCRNPWRFLVPLNYNQDTGEWDPMWLLKEQRDPRELLALIRQTQ